MCYHFDCNNRTELGFCKTTACINPKYANKTITTNKTELDNDWNFINSYGDCKWCDMSYPISRSIFDQIYLLNGIKPEFCPRCGKIITQCID